MDKQPVGQLPDINQSSNDNELMIITNDENNELRKEKISDFITDLTSTDADNSLIKGSDGKLFVSNQIDSANIEGVLNLDNIPQLTTEKLPDSGVTAGFYRNPANMSVNNKGQITAVENGETGVINDITPFVTNCILSGNGAEITTQSYIDASYVNQGCTVSEAGVASGFSTSNYILLSKTMTDATAFVMTIPFKLNALSGIQTLAAINNDENAIIIDNGIIAIKYNGLELKGSVTLAAATQYYAILTRTESGYTLEVKTTTDGTATDTVTLTSSAGYFGGKSVYLGSDRGSNYLNGEIGLTQLTITTGEETYWSNTTLSNFETVTLSGSLQVLMPNGRNEDLTLKNTETTLTLAGTLLYNNTTPDTKTIVVKDDGEIMIRDYYSESDTAGDIPLNGIWFDTNENMMKTQLNTYPNFINNGVTVAEGVVSGFGTGSYMQLPERYTLGDNWSISLDVNLQSGSAYNILGEIEDSIPDGLSLTFNGTDTLTATFRRNDVYTVSKSDGDSTVDGYVKVAGTTLVPADTTVYTDANCTSVQGTASGSDYVYTFGEVPSVIGQLTAAATPGENTITLSYDGINYTLNTQTLPSTDTLIDDMIITIGNGGSFTLDLNSSTFSFWTWNGVSEASSDIIPFVGVKIGEVVPISGSNINIVGTPTNNNGVFSGFSNTNYITFEKNFQPAQNSWQATFVFTTGSDITTQQTIMQYNSAWAFGVQNSKLRILLSSSGSSWNIAADVKGTYTIQTNTKYAVKLAWDGAKYTVAYALITDNTPVDELQYTTDMTFTSANPVKGMSTNFTMGANTQGDQVFNGSVDLNSTYININGELYWKWNGLIDGVDNYPIDTCLIDKPLNIVSKEALELALLAKTNTTQAAHAAMPSGKVIQLATPATGYHRYYAPADGYAVLTAQSSSSASTADWLWIALETPGGVTSTSFTSVTGAKMSVYLPVAKGAYFATNIATKIINRNLYFVYAEGVTND